jgi:hypothetical protein
LIVWIVALGAVGFGAGFFGPIALNPDANQGPLVGIFLTGPGGCALGLVLGIATRAFSVDRSLQWKTLAGAAILLGGGTLFFALPAPELRGEIIAFRVERCRRVADAADAADAALRRWDERIAETSWASPSPGWRERMRASLASDRGLLLDVSLERTRKIHEQRKPWNRGHEIAAAWRSESRTRAYYVPPAARSCADYVTGSLVTGWTGRDVSAHRAGPLEWPPSSVHLVLGLATLAPVPGRYQPFASP